MICATKTYLMKAGANLLIPEQKVDMYIVALSPDFKIE